MLKGFKKKVLHISHTDIRTDSRILKELAALNDTGSYELYAVGVKLAGEPPSIDHSKTFDICTISLFSNKGKWRPRFLRHMLVLIELFFRCIIQCLRLKPNIVHCHDTLVLPVGLVVKALTGAKLVYDAHELESNKNGQTRLQSKATLMAEKLCWRSIDLLVSVSPSILDWYQAHLGSKTSVLVLNSPEVREESSVANHLGDQYFHGKFGIPDDQIVFLYIGILGQGRGIDVILEAFEGADLGAHVVFLGYGDYEERIESSSSMNVHLHPAVKHNEVVSYAKSADVGLCLIENISLSDYYCLPNKFFEYAFAGLPMLVSAFPDLEAYVKKHQLGTSCPLNAESLRGKVLSISKDGLPYFPVELEDISWNYQAERLREAYSNFDKFVY